MTLSELAGRMSCEPSNANAVIDNREAAADRTSSPPHRPPGQAAAPPPAGAEYRERLLKLLCEEPLGTGLTRQEHDTLRDLLQRAISSAETPQA